MDRPLCQIARVSMTLQVNQHELAKQQDEDYACLDGKLTSQNTMLSHMVGAISDTLVTTNSLCSWTEPIEFIIFTSLFSLESFYYFSFI